MFESLQSHGLQHTRPPCLLPTPELTQIHVHQVDDAIQPSHPLLSPSPPNLNLSQHQGLFKWVIRFLSSGGQSTGVSASTSILPMNTQDWFPLGWAGWIPLQSKGLSRVFSNITVQKYQFFGTQPSLWSKSHICTWPLEKPQLCKVAQTQLLLCRILVTVGTLFFSIFYTSMRRETSRPSLLAHLPTHHSLFSTGGLSCLMAEFGRRHWTSSAPPPSWGTSLSAESKSSSLFSVSQKRPPTCPGWREKKRRPEGI